MKTPKSRYFYTAVAAAILATTTASFAATSSDNDAIPAQAAKVSLSQAIGHAEQQTGGNAVRAEYENTNAGWAYDIEVVKGAKVLDVRVDATSGSVISAVEDTVDHDDEHDAKD